jgi:predicted metal-dependent enzyme (double-stranded beta helix superfamily)
MSVEIKTESALDQFISETRELFRGEPDPENRWSALAPILAKLLADPEIIEASKHWPECVPADGRAENLLFYEDAEFGFAINGLTKGEGRMAHERQQTRFHMHDHAHLYTLYGVLDGHERVERYERIDDRSKPDYAEIQKTSDVHVGPGEIDLVKPYEIHREVSVGERTVAIIIRSEKGGSFNQGRYDPETNRYWESLGPRQTAYEMLPTPNK